MDYNNKIKLLADVLEMEGSEIKPEIELSTLENWDSLAKLSTMIMFEENVGKKVSGKTVGAFVTIKDILEQMD